MTDRTHHPSSAPAAAFDQLADEVLPALIARLDRSHLGELEVRHRGWRVRLRRGAATAVSSSPAAPPLSGPSGSVAPESARTGAISPAVGYFVPHDRTPPGHAVAAGDTVGWVEVLGVRQEVVAPRDGTVGRHLVEPGQAVEYGQELIVVDGPRRGTEPTSEPIPGPVAEATAPTTPTTGASA